MKYRISVLKYILSVACVLFVFIQSTALGLGAQSQDFTLDYDRDTQLIEIYGETTYETDIGEVSIQILRPEKSAQDAEGATSDDIDTIVYFVGKANIEQKIGTDGKEYGKYSIRFKMEAPTGRYTVRVYTPGLGRAIEQTLEYANAAEIKAVLDSINAVSHSAANAGQLIKEIIDGNLEVLGLKDSLYTDLHSTNLDAVYLKLAKADDFKSIGDITDMLVKELMPIAFTKISDEAKLKTYLDKYGRVFEQMLYAEYKSMNAAVSAIVVSALANKTYADIDALGASFDENVMLQSMLNVAVWTDFGTKAELFINQYQNKYTVLKNMNYVGFKNLSGTNQNTVVKYFMNHKSDYTTLSGFVTAFNTQVANVKDSGGTGKEGPKTPANNGTGVGNTGGIVPKDIIDPPKNIAFNDLGSVSWAKDAIMELYEKGVIKGKTEDAFEPNTNITREEFVTLIVQAFSLRNENASIEFADVDRSDWCYVFVASAKANGIVTGNDDGTFGKGKEIKREEMAAMLCRLAANMEITLEENNESPTFSDEDEISDYAVENIHTLQRASVINGMGDGSFAPKKGLSRAEAAVVIYKIMKMANRI